MRALRKALVVSAVAHAAVFGLARPLASRAAARAEAHELEPDRFAGTTAEVPTVASLAPGGDRLIDVGLDARPSEPAPAEPAPPAAPTPPAPASPAPARRSETPANPAHARPKHRPGRPEDSAGAASPDHPEPGPVSTGPAHRTAEPSGAPGPAGGTYGAEGPGAVRDLGRAFTRAIPPACDGDQAWAALPPGDAGSVEVAIDVDETGHVTGAEPRGVDPPRVLVGLVRRTLPLLQAGTFAIQGGAVGAGVQVVKILATVRDVGADEPNGLAFEYERGRGKASFPRGSGRRVEVSVRMLRVEPRRAP